jgi:RNA polymerase sigma-70 factor (ECF subfamily)
MSPGFNGELVAILPRLRAYARSLTGGRTDAADDLIQDTLARALARQHLYTPGTNIQAWTFTILHNIHINYVRRLKYQPQPIDSIQREIWPVLPHQEAALEADDLRRALATLRPAQREVVLLVGASGLSYEDAAEICECAVGTIKSRLSRARRELFNRLAGDAMPRRAHNLGHRPSARPSSAASQRTADPQPVPNSNDVRIHPKGADQITDCVRRNIA